MIDFFKFINSFTKQLSRPLNDLDDIRYAMTTLIELRNQEIKMDMEVTPIEVRFTKTQLYGVGSYRFAVSLCFYLLGFFRYTE